MDKHRMLATNFLPSLGNILFISLLFASYLLGGRMLSIDSDIGRHLALGNFMLDTHSIPLENILSHTKSGESRPPYEWGAQVLFAMAFRLAGLDGVILLTSLVISSTFLILYHESVRLTEAPISSILITILAASASSIHWLPRPHIFTLLFLLLWIIQLEKFTNPNWIFFLCLSLIMAVWANLHGGFIFGFLAWFAYFVGELWEFAYNGNRDGSRIIKFLIAGALITIASFLTPDGWGNWSAVFSNNSKYILQNTLETMSPNFHEIGMAPFMILIALSIAIPALSRTPVRAGRVFLTTGMAIMGLFMARNIPLFAISATFMLSQCSGTIIKNIKSLKNLEFRFLEIQKQIHENFWTTLFAVGFIMTIIAGFLSRGESRNQFNPKVFPVDAVKWLQANPQKGNMFNEFNWGGYLEFQLAPDQKVFLDSQTDFYGEALTRDYNQIINAQNDWETKLKKYDIDWVIVPGDAPLAQALEVEYHWRILYQDDTSVILRK